MYQLTIARQTITIEGEEYHPDVFLKDDISAFFNQNSFYKELFFFLKDWFSDAPTLQVQTSGSTGTPKQMWVEKSRMMQSAVLTCSFLGLEVADTALLCMPLKYIAGKMMVVRALVAQLNLYLVPPTGNPLKDSDLDFAFAAMIPLQVFNSLQSDKEKKRLLKIRNLIVGGGAIDSAMEQSLKDFPNKVYSTYGMTETLSHIALRQINSSNSSDYYTPFQSVGLCLSGENTLIIDAPLVSRERLYTNDVAEIYPDGSFRIVGRRDNVINSGGVKIQIEEVEALLRSTIVCPFAITSLPDPKLGEMVVLVTQKPIDLEQLAPHLPPYWMPKKIVVVPLVPLTETGKVNRAMLKELVRGERVDM